MLPLQNSLAGEALWQPGSAAAVEIPPDGVRAVLCQGLEGIHHITLGFTHLLSVLIRHQAQDDDILIGSLVEQQSGFRQEGVKPPPCLIHGLGDELRRELLLEQVFIFKRIMVLRKGHGSGVKPAVDDLRHTPHGFAALGAGEGHFIDIGPV